MGDGCGDSLCLDLAPGPGGEVGQLIHWMHDAASRTLLSPSLEWYLAFFATELEDGEYFLNEFGEPESEDRLSLVRIRS